MGGRWEAGGRQVGGRWEAGGRHAASRSRHSAPSIPPNPNHWCTSDLASDPVRQPLPLPCAPCAAPAHVHSQTPVRCPLRAIRPRCVAIVAASMVPDAMAREHAPTQHPTQHPGPAVPQVPATLTSPGPCKGAAAPRASTGRRPIERGQPGPALPSREGAVPRAAACGCAAACCMLPDP